MSIQDLNWYSANAARRYPLDDGATGVDNFGTQLPNDILVDFRLRWPRQLGAAACLSALRISPGLVTLTVIGVMHPPIYAEHDDPPIDMTPTPLAKLVLPKPVTPYRPYPIVAAAEGVGGWVVFGPGLNRIYAGSFAPGRPGLLAYRSNRPYLRPPIPGVGKPGVDMILRGVVLVKGGSDIEVVKATRSVNGSDKTCLVVRLREDASENLLQKYAGPCGGRPESGTCTEPGIQSIAGATPDCNGNINLNFSPPIVVRARYGGGGLLLGFPAEDLCGPEEPDDAVDDGCNPTSEGDPDESIGFGAPDVEDPIDISEIDGGGSLPYIDTFVPGSATAFQSAAGTWAAEPDPGDDLGQAPPSTYVYRPQSASIRSAALWVDPVGDVTLARAAEADLAFYDDLDPQQNGGVVLNYHQAPGGGSWDEYFVVEIDRDTASFRIRLWNGSGWVTMVAASEIVLTVGSRYRIRGEVTEVALPEVKIRGILTDLGTSTILADIEVTTDRYVPADGRFGLAANYSSPSFSRFAVEAI